MNTVQQLYQLQEIEGEINIATKKIAGIETQLSGNETLVKAREEIARLEAQVAVMKKAQHDNENEIADLNEKINTQEKELNSGRNTPKELQNLQIVIDGLKSRRSEVESRGIEIIEQLDGANRTLETSRTNTARLESEWQSFRLELSKNLEDLRARLGTLQEKQHRLVALIPHDAIAHYNTVKKQKGLAIAKIEQGICRGCRIQLPAREIQQARGNRIVQCSSCGRILFMP